MATGYEQRLTEDSRWALSEGSRFFEEKSAVQGAMRRIARRLDEMGVPYAVVGGMALFMHGFRRFTEDVDILVTGDGLKTIHKHLEGRGYLSPFIGSKHLRDTEFGVTIEFLVTGDYPGDGKPKPVSFPDPASVVVEHEGIKYIKLPALVDMKMASGMTNPERMKDLADVQELIKKLGLTTEFAEHLTPYVRKEYLKLCEASRPARKRYLEIWRNKFLTVDAESLDDMIASLRDAARALERMRADGVILDPEGGTADDYAHLVSSDPDVARKYGMHDEAEFLGEDTDNAEDGEHPSVAE